MSRATLANNRFLVGCVTVIIICALVGIIYLSGTGHEETARVYVTYIVRGVSYVAILLGGANAALKVQDQAKQINAKQDQMLNGVMDKKIQDNVSQVLEAHGLVRKDSDNG